MKNRSTILVLVLLLGVALAANILVRNRVPGVKAFRHQSLMDSAFAVSTIEFRSADSMPFKLERREAWTLTSPFVATAEEATILRLLDLFAWTSIQDVLTDSELLKLGRTREDFGLQNPSREIVFSDGRKSLRVALGDWTPTSNGVYVAVSDVEGVWVVPRVLVDAVPFDADAFRARDVFPFDPNFVNGFDVKRVGSPTLSLTREGAQWRLGGEAASEKKVNGFLSRIADAKICDFVWPTLSSHELEGLSSAKLTAYGLDAETAWTVVLHGIDGVDRQILLGREASDRFVYALIQNGTSVVTVDSAVKDALVEGARAFSDPRLFPVDESAVSSFSIQTEGTSFVVARAPEGAWRLDSPIAAPASANVASTILTRILSLTAADLVHENGFKVSVATNLESSVVSPKAILGEDLRLADLRSKEILRVDPSIVRRLVRVEKRGSKTVSEAIVYSRENRVWNVESSDDVGASVAEDQVERTLSLLQPLTALRVEALVPSPADWVRYGFEMPSCTLAIDQEKEGAVRLNVLIGAETEGGRFATIGSSEAVFVLSSETVSRLTRPLTD